MAKRAGSANLGRRVTGRDCGEIAAWLKLGRARWWVAGGSQLVRRWFGGWLRGCALYALPAGIPLPKKQHPG